MDQNTNTTPVSTPQSNNKNFLPLTLILGLLLIIALGSSGLLGWSYNKATNDKASLTKTNRDLQNDITSLKKQLAAAKESATTDTTTSTTQTTHTTPQTLIANIEAAINTMNTAALEGYMASSVNMVYAASEKQGPRTPAQAVSDLNILNSATAPWDFNLSAAVLSSYGNGFYGTYFGTNTVVGKSPNNYVASFRINTSDKIDTIFITVDASLLE